MPRLTLKKTFVVVASSVALFQVAAVTLAALPTNRYSDAAAPHTTYLSPMFTQNWRLFAPSPIAEDRNVLFQGSYTAADGTQKQTPWVDWTAVELDLVHHELVGGRAGYITNKLFTPLGSVNQRLTADQRTAVTAADEKVPPTWAALRTQLIEAGDQKPANISQFIRYDRAMSQLATEVLQSRWPRRGFTAVRYSFRSQAVTPYAARGGSDQEREAARPSATERISGWRLPQVGTAAERRVIADFDRRHR